jgi:hypothetical protein
MHRAVSLFAIMLAVAACTVQSQPPAQPATTAAATPAAAAPKFQQKKVPRDACLESGQPPEFCACLRQVQPRIMQEALKKDEADPAVISTSSSCADMMELPNETAEQEAE